MNFNIQELIYTLRGTQVMLDSDLAVLYGVETKVFNQAVKRNLERFPLEFRFQLTQDEFDDLRSQFVTSSAPLLRSQFVTLKPERILRSQFATLESEDLRGKHRKYLPYAFTERMQSILKEAKS